MGGSLLTTFLTLRLQLGSFYLPGVVTFLHQGCQVTQGYRSL